MKNILFAILFLIISTLTLFSQRKITANIADKNVKSVKVTSTLNANVPLIALHSKQKIDINFDIIHADPHRIGYRIFFCNADWSKAHLSPQEYVSGVAESTINDFATSSGTRVIYTNYNLRIPNEDTRPLLAGNYAVEFYREDCPEKVLFTTCFCVLDDKVEIIASLDKSIGYKENEQQLNLEIIPESYSITSAEAELKINIYQNNIPVKSGSLTPTTVSTTKIQYLNSNALRFRAGNEYRAMEFTSKQKGGLHVDSVAKGTRKADVFLKADAPRNTYNGMVANDFNGRFSINARGVADASTEADYCKVKFTLIADSLPNKDVYIIGEAFQHQPSPFNKMEYNAATASYEKEVVLKQGYYNYMYATNDEKTKTLDFSLLEGNFSETENEYTILIYHRSISQEYDKLIGYKIVK